MVSTGLATFLVPEVGVGSLFLLIGPAHVPANWPRPWDVRSLTLGIKL